MRFTRRAFLSTAPALALAPLKMPREVRVGVWGFVGHTEEIFGPLPQLEGVSVVAYGDSDPVELARGAKRRGLANAKGYSSLREMIEGARLDVVALCNDNGARAATIIECAQRKVHVIAEKPVALTPAELAGVRKAVDSNKVTLGCLLKMRTDPQFIAMQQLVASGAIGEVAQIESQKSYKYAGWAPWKSKRATYGSSIAWVGVDLIDLMFWCAGRRVTSVVSMQAHIGYPELGEMQNSTGSLFRLDNGGVAVMRLDYLRPPSAPTHGDDRLRLAGTKGVIEYQASTGLTLVTTGEPPKRIEALPERGWVFVDFLAAAFLGRKPAIPHEEIYRSTELALAAWRSAETGAPLAT